MSMRYPGGLIATSPVNARYPSGVWTQAQAAPYQAQNVWTRDQFWPNTTLLLQGDGAVNGAQNNTFLDSSSNNFTITRNGNTTQGAFTPYEQNGYWSNTFASGNYLTVPSNAALAFGTGDFTIEGWFYSNAIVNFSGMFNCTNSGAGASGFALFFNSSGQLIFSDYASAYLTSAVVSLNTWHHVAVTRSGTSLKMFIDGVQAASATNSVSFTCNVNLDIGITGGGSSAAFNGYFSNLRVVKGTAVYTSTFTPSTTPLTAISGTSLLTCQSNRFIDNSTNAFAITVNGSPSVQSFQPFPGATTWSASVLGGSGYFDGSGDYLSLTGTALGTGDFTIEFWLYPTTLGSTFAPFSYGTADNTSNAEIYIKTTGAITWYTFGEQILSSTGVIVANAWHHIAVTKSSGTTKMFVNGVQVGSNYSDSRNYTSTTIYIGQGYGVASATGYIANFRQTNTAVYTSAFTPPISPVTAITGTQLLSNFVNAGIYDNSMMNDLETVGNAQVSTSVVKYGTGSMYFDGSGDYLVSNPASGNLYAFGTGDFTIEMWLYLNTVSGGPYFIYDARPASTQGAYPCLYMNGTTLTYQVNSTDILTATVAANTWYHVAVSRAGTTIRMFVNGVQQTSATDSTTYLNGGAGRPGIGGGGYSTSTYFLNGYIDDLRITKGVARYITTFTPPPARMPNQ